MEGPPKLYPHPWLTHGVPCVLDRLGSKIVEKSMTEKRCFECKRVLPRSEFLSDCTKHDGLKGRCKACHGSYRRRHRREQRQAGNRLLGDAESLRRLKEADAADPQRVRCRKLVADAKKSGRLTPEDCSRCGALHSSDAPSHAHHEDYSKPMEVEWLCASCHGKEHAKKLQKIPG